jgi:hypothetical protein
MIACCGSSLMLTAMTSCSDGAGADEPVGATTSHELLITFSMEAPRARGTSRANGTTWADNTNIDSEAYDSGIDPETVNVAIYSTSGSLIATVERVTCTKADDGTYTYYGRVTNGSYTSGATYRCMVTANTSSTVNFSRLGSQTFSPLDATNFNLPLWGVKTFTYNIDSNDIGRVDMLRAAAKCRICLSDDMLAKGFTLSNVKLNTQSTTGFVAPNGYASAANTAELDYNDCFNPAPRDAAASQLLFSAEPNTENSYIIYFAECTNTTDAPVTAELTLNSKDMTANTYTVNFKDYNTQQPYTQLTRNHLYNFEITGAQHEIEVTSNVSDWTVDEETLEFENNITIEGDKKLYWTEGTYAGINEDEHYVTLLGGVELQGVIKFRTPVAATWFATLTAANSDDNNNAILFDNRSTYATGTIDGVHETTLHIVPDDEDNAVQHSATLTIYVKFIDGSTTRVSEIEPWTIIQTI